MGALGTADLWLKALGDEGGALSHAVLPLYGGDRPLWGEQSDLLKRTIACFLDQFGNAPVRVFRAPGRINLRGMHVDTHGGYVNLMTHHREVFVVASPREEGEEGEFRFQNLDAQFHPVAFSAEEVRRGTETGRLHPGDWGDYLFGAVLSARKLIGEGEVKGMCAAVGSNLPRGACLSSSAALCVATLQAVLACNEVEVSEEGIILAARDAEWYAGARTGTGDQSAVVLGRPGQVLHGVFMVEDFDIRSARYLAFPEPLDVLVIQSFTRRSLSGADLSAYTTNRFAYSMSIQVVQRALREMGFGEEEVARMDRLSRLNPEALGGDANVYRLLMRIPESVQIEALRGMCDAEGFDEVYGRYFGGVPEGDRSNRVNLRGPLAFGLAESERARRFFEALGRDAFEEAGRLMTVGHAGDRVGACDLSDAALLALAEKGTPLAWLPGAYGASSLALDSIVDVAVEAGALGASLTGAGIAGAVLALCRKEASGAVAERVREWLGTGAYARLAHLPGPLGSAEMRGVVEVNRAVAGAGEMMFPT